MIKGIRKKFISIFTAFAMVINLMPAFTLTAHAASVAGTLTFFGPDTIGDMPPMAPIVNDGISYSTSYGIVRSPDIPNIGLDIFGAASVDNAKNNIASGNMYYYKDTSNNLDGIGNNDETNGKIIVIKSNDRTGFSFQSIQMNDATATSLKIEGFRDGSLIDYDMLSLSGVYNDTFSWGSGLTQSKFENVDEVRIINPNGNALFELLINNIKIGDPVIPKVSSVSIDGTTQVGQTLTGKYTFTDPNSGATDKSTYQWYRAKSVTGEGAVAISGATSKNYTLTTFDTDKDSDPDEIYIGLKVTPNDGTYSGTAVTTTTYVGPITTSSLQNNYIVTNTNDSGTGSLRWAIQQAGLYGNGNITFDSSLKGATITLTSDLTTWDTSNDIFGKSRYSGAQLNDFSGNFTLTGLTDDSGTPAITINGGGHIGIWATGSGSFNISNLKFTNFTLNSTNGTYEGFGAAVATGGQYTQVNLSNVIFDINAAHTNINAGIVSLSANAEPWEVNVDRCVFSNNTISEADSNISNTPIAGALYINTANKLKLTNSLFVSNIVSTNTASTVYGGAAFVCNGGADVLNCTFYNNKLTNADSDGSAKGAAVGVYGSETVPFNLYNNIMIGNTANGSDSTYFTNNGTSSNAAFNQSNNLLTGTASNIFTDAASGKFTLSSTATDAINKGNNTYTFGSYDLAGNNRIINSTVDLGAYEYKAPPSTDATLKSSSTVKGQTVTSLGTPNETLGLVTAGSVTITASQAVNTSNAGSFITLFDMNESHSAVKVVKYAAGATPDTTTFSSASAYANQSITDGDFFIVKVTAQDGTTINYYKINVTVTPAGNYTAAASASTLTPSAGADNEITLTVKDSLGNTDTGFNGTKNVTITGVETAPNGSYGSFNGAALNANSAGAGQVISVTFTDGVATVKLNLNKADEQTIGFSIGTVTSPATNTLNITPTNGSASSMTVTRDITAPTINGGNFAQQPVITINDAYGNMCTSDNSTVVTAAKKDTGTWTLTGTTTAKAILGVVTFTNLGATNTALVNNAQLGFTSGSMTEVASAAVTLPAPAGNRTAAASASTLTPSAGADNEITLTVKDSLGNTDTGFNGTKNVTITGVETAPNGSYGSFNGTALDASSVVSGQVVSVTFTDGVATVKLNLNKAAGQTIGFSIDTVTTPATNTLNITPTNGSASSMTVTRDITAPAVNGGSFAQQPIVTLKDAYGNMCTSDNSTVVTAAKKDTGTWTLTGTTTAKAILGVVTFTNLGASNTALVNNAQLGFTSGSMTEVTSAAVTLPAPAPSGGGTGGTDTPTPISVDTTVTGTVVDSTTGEVVKGVPATVTTFSDGTKTIAVKSQDAILFKGTSSTNGTNGTINDFTKLNFSTPETTGTSEGTKAPSVDIKQDGTIQVQNLHNGSETKFHVTIDLGNGKKIVIGSICVKMSQTGDVSLTSTLIDPYGIVTDEDTGKVIDGAHVVLYYADTDRNKANGKTPDTLVELPEISGFKPNDNANPQESDSFGAYGFMVFPTTDYYLVATKDGYNKYTSPTISVEQEIVKWDFKMTKLNLTNPVITIIGDKEVTVKQHETYTDAGATAKDSNGIDITKNIVTSNTVDTNKAGDYTITYNVTDRSGNKAAEVTRIVHVVSIGKPIITLLGNAEINIKQHKTYTDAGATAVDALGTDITNRIEITNSVDTNKMGDYKVTYNVKDKDGNIADTVTRIVHVIGAARIAGDTRVDTAIEIAKASYPQKLSNVILATADNYPDALAGGPLAHKLNAPILLVGSSDEDQQKVLDYMKEYVDQSGTVYILGGKYVVSPEMENKVASNGFKNINRIAGEDRYETAAKIADVLNEGSGKPVILVTGENYPDALSISSVAAANQYNILFVETSKIPECTKNKLEQLKPSKIYIVGLHQVVTPEVESKAAEISGLDKSNVIRIGGEDRYETSLAVAKYFNLNSGNICIATGNNFPDAITGSVYAAENNSPIILVDNDFTDSQKQYLQSQKLSKVIIFGGKYVVSEEIEQQINQVMDKYIK